jgi:hypothetical protein
MQIFEFFLKYMGKTGTVKGWTTAGYSASSCSQLAAVAFKGASEDPTAWQWPPSLRIPLTTWAYELEPRTALYCGSAAAGGLMTVKTPPPLLGT